MKHSENANEAGPVWLQLVQQHIGSLRFGVVQIVVHDRRVVQIEQTDFKGGARDLLNKGEKVILTRVQFSF